MLSKKELFSIIKQWNYWDRALPETKVRPLYDEQVSRLSALDECLVIKGVRRSGKSTLMINQIKKLVESGLDTKSILFVNLEDARLMPYLGIDLLDQIKAVYLELVNPDGKPHVFLDEVQQIPSWENWVNTEYELKSASLCVSGSNSAMSVEEISTTLTGRYVSVDVYPLSFKEYLYFKGLTFDSVARILSEKIKLNQVFEQYKTSGGFPTLVDQDEATQLTWLTNLKNSILFSDIVKRYALRSSDKLEVITAFFMSQVGSEQNPSKVRKNFQVSQDLAQVYIEYLRKAYLIYELPKFDYSLKTQHRHAKKYYPVDLGLANLFRVPNLSFEGVDIEALVFLELKRRGYKLYYYKDASFEVDFILEEKNQIKQLIQVCVDLSDDKTKQRELKAFVKAKALFQLNQVECVVYTLSEVDSLEYQGVEVQVKNLYEWFLLDND